MAKAYSFSPLLRELRVMLLVPRERAIIPPLMATIPCIRCGAQIDRAFKACPHCGEPLTDFLREYADKPIDGKYRIVQRLGIGGMGEVFKVEHTFLGSTRVVKIIRAQISSSSDAHERFLRIAQIDRAFKACPHCGEPLTDFLREYADKPIDGKYRIVQRLGIGGMGEVFKVEHTFLGSTRVVKIIRAQISSSSDAHERFLRIARMATKLQ